MPQKVAIRSKKPSKTSKKGKKRGSKKGASKVKTLDVCFTIMPFGGWFDDYYIDIYRPAIEAAGLKPHRADDLYRPSTIVNDIWAYTKKAKVVLADLSGKNPNVFYELGLAHALAKPAILIAESMDDVPFDLRSLRVIEYDKNDPDWGQTLSEKIGNAIGEVVAAPLQSVLPAFLDLQPQKEKPKISERDKDLLELRQEVESLRAEFRRSPSDAGPRGISITEARQKIQDYLALGAPTSFIVRQLVRRGAPESWVTRTLEQYQKESAGAELSESSEKANPPLAAKKEPKSKETTKKMARKK